MILFYFVVCTILAMSQYVMSEVQNVSQPISPSEYQEIIGQGFSTNWFKIKPITKYRDQNIVDIYAEGFKNVRLRARADLYSPPYDNDDFNQFLTSLSAVVDKCLDVGVTPIISWIHHHAEAYASDADRQNYVKWWKTVAEKLKNKDYRLSFNLFTELGIDGCGDTCGESLRRNTAKYNQWTSKVVEAIRETGGNNEKRILILASPGKTAKDLYKIDPSIYADDEYMMVEWHIYASGPNKNAGSLKYWSGDGKDNEGRENVKKAIEYSTDFTKSSNLTSYFGAWMPADNKDGSLTQTEVINFARFFASELKKEKIPWSINVLDLYYDTKQSQWITELQDIKGQSLDMAKILKNIKAVM